MPRFALSSLLAALLVLHGKPLFAEPPRGACVPWITYEAEEMTIRDGSIIGPPELAADKNKHQPPSPAMESSGRRCVQLDKPGASVQFTARAEANAIVVRYSLPDSPDGAGLDSQLALSINGAEAAVLPITSKYSWRYGPYPFVNDPGKGNPRNFYDEVRFKGLTIHRNDAVKISRINPDLRCLIDFVDLEDVPAPLAAPAGALDVTAAPYGADPAATSDATAAFRKCLEDAGRQSPKTVWIPAGTYLISGDLNIPGGITVQGAGMWHSTLVGDPAKYNLPHKAGERQRVRINGTGSNIHLADFAIIGKLNYRNDDEANDGLGETFGAGSSISRLWIEHTKTGAWIVNSSGLLVEDCRFRNTIADGINLCVGMRASTIKNCTARGCGDDGFAIWPATYTAQKYAPGLNVIKNCTASLCSLGNGAGIYGGESNTVQDCLFQDVPFGCGILIAGTFPIGENKFSGTTIVRRCDILRCGGFDSGWNAWRGAVTICPQNNDISGLEIDHVNLSDSLSYALQFANPGGKKTLSGTTLHDIAITNFGVAVAKASKTPYCDGASAIAGKAPGPVTFNNLTINGELMKPDSETLIALPAAASATPPVSQTK
jgi:Pectate lyase superfamily protein